LKKNYDVIIIGGGISGLTNSALLSKAGLSCCVIEKEPVIGGYLSGFRRKDFRFDTAIHWLNQCGENGMVTKMLKLIGTDHPKAVSMANIHRFKSKNIDYLLTNKPDILKAQLIKDFPKEKKGIVKLFKLAKRIGKTSENFKNIIRTKESMNYIEKIKHTLKGLKIIAPIIPYVFYNGDKGITKGLNKFFKDKGLHNLFLSETDLLSCLFPIAWAYINDYQNPVSGGSQVYPEWLSYVTKYFDNDIILNAEVKQICIKNNIGKSVVYEKKGKEFSITSKYIIAACDVELLYKKLLPKGIVSKKFLNNLDKASLYSSGAAVYIALDCPARQLGIYDELISLTREDIQRHEHMTGDPLKSSISFFSPSERDNSLAPQDKGILSIYISADIKYNNYWQTEKDKDGSFIRGEKYKKHKSDFAKALIHRVETELNLNIKDHILFYEVSTPITYYRYTGNRDGSIMGARPGKENMQAKIAHYQTPIKNLYLSGHWAELGGGIPITTQTAINSSLMVLRKENKSLFKLIAKYIDGYISLNDVYNAKLLKEYDNSWKQELTPAEKLKFLDKSSKRL